MPGEIAPESWAASDRNGGRDHLGTVGDFSPESATIACSPNLFMAITL